MVSMTIRRWIGCAALAASAFLTIGGAQAQQPFDSLRAGGAVVYEGARLIVGDGKTIESSAFVVENGRISQVGARGQIKAPAGASRVDLTGKTVMPAIVDAHTHMPTERQALVDLLQRKAYFGVAAVISMGQDNNDVAFQLRQDPVPGAARLRTVGRGLTAPEPGRTEAPYWVTTEAEARKAVQELAAKKVDMVKIWVDDRDGKYKKLTPELYGAIIDEAHKNKLRVTAHIYTLDDAKGLLRAGLDGFAHTVRDKDIDDEFVGLAKKQKGLFYVPNLPDSGVKTDLGWLSDSVSAQELTEASGRCVNRSAGCAEAVRHSSAESCADEQGRLLHRDGNRRRSAVGASPRDGRHGGGGYDAGPGHHHVNAERRAVVAARRSRHRCARQKRRLHRARCQSARRHHEHAKDLRGVSAWRRHRSRGHQSAHGRREVDT